MGMLLRLTPFRQLLRAYLSFLDIGQNLKVISDRLDVLNGSVSATGASIRECTDSLNAKTAETSDFINTHCQIAPSTQSTALKDVDIYQRMGFDLLLEKSSLVDGSMIQLGNWEPRQLDNMMRLAEYFRGKNAPIFLDIGSYWGLYSLVMSRTGLFDSIYAFEADAYNFSQLQANLFLNKATKLINSANRVVAASAGTEYVFDSQGHPDGNRGGVGIVHEGFEFPTTRVESISIDDYLQLKDANILVKIDVESYEKFVLQGMKKTLADNRVIMQIEVYEPQDEVVFPMLEGFGLNRFHQIDHDFYYTNIPLGELEEYTTH